jgi:DNA-3-methyladenine glycosylase II
MNYLTAFKLMPAGPFDLANQNRYFGGWPTLSGDPDAIVMAFPLEGSGEPASAAVVLRQETDGSLTGEVHGCQDALGDAAGRQALATVSLDVDGTDWPLVGRRDPVIGELQAKYRLLRPVLFHSPYEAAAAFIIGHRISIKQTRVLRARIAAEAGTTIDVHGEVFSAFPAPGQLLEASTLPGITPTKLDRLRAVAMAAQDGVLDRDRLRELTPERALAELQRLPGIGPFFAQGILYRGAGIVDGITDDPITSFALTQRYGLEAPADRAKALEIAEAWRPYRMWAAVLLHMWAREQPGLPRQGRR